MTVQKIQLNNYNKIAAAAKNNHLQQALVKQKKPIESWMADGILNIWPFFVRLLFVSRIFEVKVSELCVIRWTEIASHEDKKKNTNRKGFFAAAAMTSVFPSMRVHNNNNKTNNKSIQLCSHIQAGGRSIASW